MAELDVAAPFAGSGNYATVFASGPILELQSGPTDSARLIELSLTVIPNGLAATLCVSLGLGVPAAKGVGDFTKGLSFINGFRNTALPGVMVITAWDLAPTIPVNFSRRLSYNPGNGANGLLGQPAIFSFPRGLVMPKSSSLVVWLITNTNVAGNSGIIFDPTVVMDA